MHTRRESTQHYQHTYFGTNENESNVPNWVDENCAGVLLHTKLQFDSEMLKVQFGVLIVVLIVVLAVVQFEVLVVVIFDIRL